MGIRSLPSRDSVEAQRELFRRATSDAGLSIGALAKRHPDLKATTMAGWRDGADMPAWALFALGQAGVPDHILSLIGAPFAKHVGTDEDGDGDLDTAADAALDFAHDVQRARSPKSPGGTAIVPQERVRIVPKGQRACSLIRSAAA